VNSRRLWGLPARSFFDSRQGLFVPDGSTVVRLHLGWWLGLGMGAYFIQNLYAILVKT
jgi:hypothetical protein